MSLHQLPDRRAAAGHPVTPAPAGIGRPGTEAA